MTWDGIRDHMMVDQEASQATADHYLQRIRRALRWGCLLPSDVDELDMARARRVLVKVLQDGKKNITYNGYLYALQALAKAQGNPDHPILDLSHRTPESTNLDPLTDAEVDALYRWDPADPMHHRKPVGDHQRRVRRAYMATLLVTGGTSGEVYKLRPQDLSRDPPRITIARPTRRHQPRSLPMPEWVFSPRRPLGAYLDSVTLTDQDTIWVREDGQPYSYASLNDWHQLATEDLGFNVNSRLTRHTFATRARQRGADLFRLMADLGHQNPTSTLIYVQIEDVDRPDGGWYRDPDPYQRRRWDAHTSPKP